MARILQLMAASACLPACATHLDLHPINGTDLERRLGSCCSLGGVPPPQVCCPKLQAF